MTSLTPLLRRNKRVVLKPKAAMCLVLSLWQPDNTQNFELVHEMPVKLFWT
jgi:hypothetical protein